MPKFIVRTGYAYHVPKSPKKFAAGETVELDNIEIGDQKWKLEPLVELKSIPLKKNEPKTETKKERKAREKAKSDLGE